MASFDVECGRVISVLLLYVAQFNVAQDFGYDGVMGPSHWGEQYTTCFGKHQSPININSLTVTRAVLPPLIMKGFDAPPDKTNITNNGHTVMYTLDAEQQPTISGGPLNGVYEFVQMHFHWGDNDTLGSEDLIDGVSFPMELHMVFYKKMYRNQRDALEHADGLAVMAFFYELQEKNNPYYSELTTLLENITEPGFSGAFAAAPTLRELLPNDLVHYFTYNGSLTTPPCSEVVTWIDFKEPIPLSHNQIEAFRALQDSHGHHLTHNFRPIQDIGDRIVLFNIDNVDDNTLEAQVVNRPATNVDDEIPEELDPSTVYITDTIASKTTVTRLDGNGDRNHDDDDDVGIGSVQQNKHAQTLDDNELMLSDMPQLDRDDTPTATDGAERAGNPKLKALTKGKENGAGECVSQVSRICVLLVAVVAYMS